MRKPFQTGAKSNSQPNEPKEYPGDQSVKGPPGGQNLDGFAENASIRPPDQLQHLSVPIDSEHILGKSASEGKGLHADTKMASSPKMPKFADKVKVPRVRTGLKNPKV